MMTLPPYSVEEFWKIVAALANDLRRCTSALEVASKEDDARAVQSWRRMCAHVVFASLEGAAYHMLHVAYVARDMPDVCLSPDELARLEEAYDFDAGNKSKPDLTPERRLDRIKFAFNAFARVHCSDYLLDADDEAWLPVKEIFLIENRLTHPQAGAEMNISDESVTGFLEGTAWIMKQMVSLLESSEQSIEDRATFLKEENDELIM